MLPYYFLRGLSRIRNFADKVGVCIVGAGLSYSSLVPLFVWLVLYPNRIWALGFYHDDWTVLRRPEPVEISSQAAQFASRPVLVLVNWAAGYLIGTSPIAWQAIMALMALGSAFAISSLVSKISSVSGRSDEEARAAGNLSGAVWLALPWSLGYTAFPTTFNAMLSVLAFSAGSIIVMSDRSLGKKLWLGIPLNLFHGLMFEIFLGAPVLIAVLYAVINRTKRRILDSENLILVGAFLCTQVVLVLYNRLWAWLGIGQNKSFGSDALALFFRSLTSLHMTLGTALLLHELTFGLLVLILVVGLLDAIEEHRLCSTVAVLVVAAFCTATSVMIYTLGGYSIEAKGLSSRTTFGLSLWLPIGLASLAPVLSSRRPVTSMVSVVSIAGLLLILSASQMRNLPAWKSTWNFEKSVIASFPVADYMAKAQPGALLLVEAEAPDQEVAGFNAFWDISSALFTSYPQIRQFYASPFGGEKRTWAIAAMLNEPRLSSEWDGLSLTQRWCAGPIIWTLAAPGELLVWRYPSPKIEIIQAPTTFGCRK